METIRIPSIIADKVSPRAREVLKKVKKFVEEECIDPQERLSYHVMLTVTRHTRRRGL